MHDENNEIKLQPALGGGSLHHPVLSLQNCYFVNMAFCFLTLHLECLDLL